MDDAPSDEHLAASLRRVIDRVRREEDGLFERVDQAALRGQGAEVVADPVLNAAIRKSVRSNINAWLDAVSRDPFAPVPANDSLEAVSVAREFRRRGLEDASIVAFRDGQAAAWEQWVELGSEIIDDPQELSTFLTYSARSVFAFIDATTAAIEDRLEGRRRQAAETTRQRELVAQILDHRAIDPEEARRALRYRLDDDHLAAIIWTQQLDDAETVLDMAVQAVEHIVGEPGLLQVPHGTATRWIWIGQGQARSPEAIMTAVAEAAPTARLALGLPARGPEGFRRSHREALAAQRLIGASGAQRSADWGELELVALLIRRPSEAQRFITRTLGELASADAELRETVRTYIRLGTNATRTAEVMFTHRNTIIGRIRRADEMLPTPIATNGVRIACALEAARWLPAA